MLYLHVNMLKERRVGHNKSPYPSFLCYMFHPHPHPFSPHAPLSNPPHASFPGEKIYSHAPPFQVPMPHPPYPLVQSMLTALPHHSFPPLLSFRKLLKHAVHVNVQFRPQYHRIADIYIAGVYL